MTLLAPMFAIAAVAPPAKKRPSPRAFRAPRRPHSARNSGPRKAPYMIGMVWVGRCRRPGEGAVHDRDALVGALVQPRGELHADARQRRVEDEAAVSGVVMRDED